MRPLPLHLALLVTACVLPGTTESNAAEAAAAPKASQAPAQEGVPPLPIAHDIQQIEGWTVHVDKRLLSPPQEALGRNALAVLQRRLADVRMVLPEERTRRLQQIPIWIDLTHGKLKPAQYHPSAGWLTSNGYSSSLAKAVHIPDAAAYASVRHQRIQPWSILHELAHAYHDQVLGFENAEIQKAWEAFRDSHKYEKVLHIEGKLTRHYALTNAKEFFAEMTEAYFGVNDFFPFNRAEFQQAEPALYEQMSRWWAEPALPSTAGSTQPK